MSQSFFTESAVEDTALSWPETLGWRVAHGPEIAPGAQGAERSDYGQLVLESRLRDALGRLKLDLPTGVVVDALRRPIRPEGATLEARNRAFHRMVVHGVTVEYRAGDGAVRGGQAQVLGFDGPSVNDWLRLVGS